MINVHETAIVEDARSIGAGTKIWAFSHVSKGAIIGEGCSIGEGVYIGPGVKIGHSCKIQNRAQIYAGVTIGNEVFIGPGVLTSNDIMPKAVGDWQQRFMETLIEDGVSVGVGSIIICGYKIGKDAVIGAGSLVAQNIKPGWLAYGSPAHHIRKL
jgi:UDP-2-acetamido-3-amino-2,3-dideoxy-glucuronate N-acetyltransferase